MPERSTTAMAQGEEEQITHTVSHEHNNNGAIEIRGSQEKSESTSPAPLIDQQSPVSDVPLPKDSKEEKGGVSFSNVLRFATQGDIAVLYISSMFIAAAGTTGPLTAIVFGRLTATFQDIENLTESILIHTIDHYCLYYVYLGAASCVCTFLAMLGFNYVAQRITQRIRTEYVAAVLRQNIGFFDETGTGELLGQLTGNIITIQEGLTDKIAFTIAAISTLIAGYAVAFYKSWKLTLCLTATVIVLVLVSTVLIAILLKYRLAYLDASASASIVAEDIISSISSTVSSNSQEKVSQVFDRRLERWKRWGLRMRITYSMLISTTAGILLLNYGLAFWVGALFLTRGELTRAHVVTCLLALISSAFALAQITPSIQGVISGLAAASKVVRVINRESSIDPSSTTGHRPETIDGFLALKNVTHSYVTRPDVVVLDDFSLDIPAGKRTALVGLSGSGKSTVVELIQRFYDPSQGMILLDGHDTRELNVQWLREQMALVGQEPMLFDTSVFENISYGLRGSKYQSINEEKRRQLVFNAAKIANAHDFISSLPDGYDTSVGRHGSLLSGGQKQRICIARAVVGDPKILLLDEATSALDMVTERIVQSALDAAGEGRTTLVVAHRLSTIRRADNIVVMSAGRIVEQGTHDELIAIDQGTYRGLVEAQAMIAHKDMEEREMDPQIIKQPADVISEASTSPLSSVPGSSTDLIPKILMDDALKDQYDSAVGSVEDTPPPDKEYSLWSIVKFVLSMNRPEWLLMSVSFVFSVLAGLDYPVSAVFFGKILAAYRLPPAEYGELKHEVDYWCRWYIMLGIVELVIYSLQGIGFSLSSEILIYRIRSKTFQHIVRQDMTFFDQPENSASTLTTLLSREPNRLATVSGTAMGSVVMIITTILGGFILSTAIAWKIAVVAVCTVPIILSAGVFQINHQVGLTKRLKSTYENSASYIAEVVANIRTVASLSREKDIQRHYIHTVYANGKNLMRSTFYTSFLYAVSESASFPCMGLVFWWGGNLLAKGSYNITQYYITYVAIVFGAFSATTFVRNSRNMGDSRAAGQALLSLFDRKPEIDVSSNEGDSIDQTTGSIEFRDVYFRYHSRQMQPVLRGLSLKAKPGQFVALVGPSGSGKSTTIALLERFYNATAGQILLDDRDITSLNVRQYRSHLAVVSQEPVLYQGTIRENVALSSEKGEVPEEDIVTACKEANIYDFIMSLPDGFETMVGAKGSLLSGGQKQRIAIARALIRKPKVLLLDEATSALDAESEGLVNQTLEAAARGRTTICVTHRLSSIQHSDVIHVLDRGRIVESGTHQELLDMQGLYFALATQQKREAGQ